MLSLLSSSFSVFVYLTSPLLALRGGVDISVNAQAVVVLGLALLESLVAGVGARSPAGPRSGAGPRPSVTVAGDSAGTGVGAAGARRAGAGAGASVARGGARGGGRTAAAAAP